MLKEKALLSFHFLLLVLAAPAQKHGENWVFAEGGGISFQYTSNIRVYWTRTFNFEVNASISDTSGELLFYLGQKNNFLGGMDIYNKNHEMIENGDSLKIDRSATNGAVILPKPESDSLFYIFHKDIYEPFSSCPYFSCIGLYQTIVRLQSSGELSVIEKNKTVLMDPSGEKIAVTQHANGRDWWLLMQATPKDAESPCTNKFYVYLVTKDSLELYSNQTIGALRCHEWSFVGEMTFNRRGTQLAAALTLEGVVELYDFDRCTGILSNNMLIDKQPSFLPYGCEFSPNGQYLYISDPLDELPAKLFQYNLTNLNKTLIWVDTFGVYGGQLQLAPDNKIYFGTSPWVFAPYNRSIGVINQPNYGGLACSFEPFSFYLGDSSRTSYGLPNMPNYELGPLSIYQAKAGEDKSYCSDTSDGVYVGSQEVSGVQYAWNPPTGLDDPTKAMPFASPSQTTLYILTVSDTSIKYSCQTRDDSVLVIVENCIPIDTTDTRDTIKYSVFFPDAFTPNQDGNNDLFGPVTPGTELIEFKIYNRWGQLIHNTPTDWDGKLHGIPQPMGTYVFQATLQLENEKRKQIKGVFTLLR